MRRAPNSNAAAPRSRRSFLPALLAAPFVLAVALVPAAARATPAAPAAQPAASRLVVWESFSYAGCAECAAADRYLEGYMAELAAAGTTIVGIQQNIGQPEAPGPDPGGRRGRFFSVFDERGGGDSATLPLFMIDSGRDIHTGPFNDDDAMQRYFERWFTEALARPARAELAAWWQRRGASTVGLEIDLTNTSDAAFDPAVDDAALVFIFYDDRNEVGYPATQRFAARWPLDEPLGPGETMRRDLVLDELSGVNFGRAKLLVLLEDRPFNQWDIAQAAHAVQGRRDPGASAVIAITAPEDGVQVTLGDDVAFEAEITGGTTDKVSYYAGDAFLAEASSPPWRAVWTTDTAGTFDVTAETTIDNNVVTSAPVRVVVAAPEAPTATPGATATATPAPPRPTATETPGVIIDWLPAYFPVALLHYGEP